MRFTCPPPRRRAAMPSARRFAVPSRRRPPTSRRPLRRLRFTRQNRTEVRSMAMTQAMVEEVTAWCRDNPDMADERREARAHFFGDDDPRPVSYWGGADDFASKERRFLG